MRLHVLKCAECGIAIGATPHVLEDENAYCEYCALSYMILAAATKRITKAELLEFKLQISDTRNSLKSRVWSDNVKRFILEYFPELKDMLPEIGLHIMLDELEKKQ